VYGHLGDLEVDGRIILKLMLNKCVTRPLLKNTYRSFKSVY
jgi:hypothetical protein